MSALSGGTETMIVTAAGQEPVVVRTGDNPFEVCFTAFFLAWGAVSLVALSEVSGSSSRIIPTWGIYLFFGCLAAGSATTLAGIGMVRFLQNLFGLEVERAGLTALGGLCLAYSLWTVAAVGPRAASFVFIVGGAWTGAAWRIWQVTRDLKKLDEGRPR